MSDGVESVQYSFVIKRERGVRERERVACEEQICGQLENCGVAFQKQKLGPGNIV